MHTWKRFLTIKDPEPELLVRAWQRQGWLGELRRWVGTGCECGKRWVPARVRLEIVQRTDKGESVMARGGLHTAREGRLSGANQPRVPLGESCSDHPSLPIPGRERSAAAPIKSLLLGAREAGSFLRDVCLALQSFHWPSLGSHASLPQSSHHKEVS